MSEPDQLDVPSVAVAVQGLLSSLEDLEHHLGRDPSTSTKILDDAVTRINTALNASVGDQLASTTLANIRQTISGVAGLGSGNPQQALLVATGTCRRLLRMMQASGRVS